MLSFWIATLKHKIGVLKYTLLFSIKLIWRGIFHDCSKFSLLEGKVYSTFFPDFKKVTYGTEEYKNLLKKVDSAIRHHYSHNRHHPEHFTKGYTSMNLLDITEMFLDWKAVSKSKNGSCDLKKSLLINQERFNISEDIMSIFYNSVNL